ncbi:hypothetical protein MKZ38_005861 [Zalerion maritima]|uniref:Uncharacterized protein n=1 Tax=Zalerion maritima TaxID=339359 RepID=A0AAD5WP11_9PEZI|nr:hypothetical protein MKZ38_005861 [Zalerion maritima]
MPKPSRRNKWTSFDNFVSAEQENRDPQACPSTGSSSESDATDPSSPSIPAGPSNTPLPSTSVPGLGPPASVKIPTGPRSTRPSTRPPVLGAPLIHSGHSNTAGRGRGRRRRRASAFTPDVAMPQEPLFQPQQSRLREMQTKMPREIQYDVDAGNQNFMPPFMTMLHQQWLQPPEPWHQLPRPWLHTTQSQTPWETQHEVSARGQTVPQQVIDPNAMHYLNANRPFIQFLLTCDKNNSEGNGKGQGKIISVEPFPIDSTTSRAQRTKCLVEALEKGEYKRVLLQPLFSTYSNKRIGLSAPQQRLETAAPEAGLSSLSLAEPRDHRLTPCYGCTTYLVSPLASHTPSRHQYPYMVHMQTAAGPGYYFHVDCFDALYRPEDLLPAFLHLGTEVAAASSTSADQGESDNSWGLPIRLWFETGGHMSLDSLDSFIAQHDLFEASLDAVIDARLKSKWSFTCDPTSRSAHGGICGCPGMPAHPIVDVNSWVSKNGETCRLTEVLRYVGREKMPMSVKWKIIRVPPGFSHRTAGSKELKTQDYGIPPNMVLALRETQGHRGRDPYDTG